MKLVQYPHVDKTDVSWNRFGKLYRMTKLIVGVFGTSSKQGKYTLQLMLRKRFVQMGYNIGQIGTEPSALLFGMDYVFPMGYNSTVSIHEYDTITYLNNAIHNMEIAGKDIIIVGSQSGTVTYDYGNLQQFAVNQYSYLLGTLPELIVLCINPYDNDTYIRRTINFIENSIETKVFALVLFPMNVRQYWQSIYGTKYHMSEEELDQKKKTIETNLEIDTYILDREEDIDQLFERIVSYFSA